MKRTRASPVGEPASGEDDVASLGQLDEMRRQLEDLGRRVAAIERLLCSQRPPGGAATPIAAPTIEPAIECQAPPLAPPAKRKARPTWKCVMCNQQNPFDSNCTTCGQLKKK